MTIVNCDNPFFSRTNTLSLCFTRCNNASRIRCGCRGCLPLLWPLQCQRPCTAMRCQLCLEHQKRQGSTRPQDHLWRQAHDKRQSPSTSGRLHSLLGGEANKLLVLVSLPMPHRHLSPVRLWPSGGTCRPRMYRPGHEHWTIASRGGPTRRSGEASIFSHPINPSCVQHAW